MKKAIIWILIVLLLLDGGATVYYLFSIGAIGFELPEATDPAKCDLIALYAEPTEPVTEPAPTEPEPTEPAPTEPVTEPAPTEPEPTEPAPTEPEPTEPADPEATEEGPREISAEIYFVYDLRDKEFLTLSGKETQKTYPASITKLMTAYTALQYMQPEDKITVGPEIQLINWDSSRAYLKEGDAMTVAQCIRAMLLPSGNDAAYALAANVGRKIADKSTLSSEAAIAKFVSAMNSCAEDLGMEHSHFGNPDGMHLAEHYTCPKDLVTLTNALMKTPEVLEAAGTQKYSVEFKSRTATWRNTNYLLNQNSKQFEPNAMGLKTGYTSYAGNCLLSMFYDYDRLYLVGTFNCPTQSSRYLDTRQLYAEIFEEN